MVNITSLIYDPSPGVTPGDGSIIRTDMYNAIADLLNGISTENYNLVQKISKKTTTYAIALSDFAIICDATSAGFTVTLPDATAAGISRKMYAIKKTDSTANVVTVATTSSQTIDGSVGTTITQQNEVIFLQSDGTNWQLLGRSLKSILPLANIFTADQTIREDGSAAQLFLEAYGTGNYGHYISKAARGSLASPTASLANDILGSIGARSYGATTFSTDNIAVVRFLAAENQTDSARGSYISFFTTKNTTTTLSEAFRINNDGTHAFWNPAFTFKYTVTPAAITADRVLNVPLLTADDTLAVLGLAQTFTKGQTITPSSATALSLTPPTAPTGSSSAFFGGLKISAGTVAFATSPQTGDYSTNYIDQATLTNPSSGTITNATSLKIVGAPIASTNVTITNAYALWVAAGITKLDGAITAAGALTSTGGITMSSADIKLAGNKIGFNVGLTSYIYESSANILDHFVGGINVARFDGTGAGIATFPQNTLYELLKLPSTSKGVLSYSFITPILNAYWVLTNVAGTGSVAVQDSEDGGTLITSGATSGNASALAWNHVGRTFIHNNSMFLWVANLTQKDANTNSSFGLKFDETQNLNTNWQDAATWNFEGGTNWICRTGDSSSTSGTDSGVAADTSRHQFKGILGSSNVKFYLDGVLKVTKSSNLPTQKMQPEAYIQTATSSAKSATVIWFEGQNLP